MILDEDFTDPDMIPIQIKHETEYYEPCHFTDQGKQNHLCDVNNYVPPVWFSKIQFECQLQLSDEVIMK